MSYCETQTESLLQAILTLAIAIPFSVGIRNPSYSQWLSGYASLTMVIARLSKSFLPPELWNHHEKSSLPMFISGSDSGGVTDLKGYDQNR